MLNRVLKDYPKLVAEHNEVILRCVDDADVSIRKRALDLLSGMVHNFFFFETISFRLFFDYIAN